MSELPFFDLDDDGFNLFLYELLYGRINFDSDRLSELIFNPLLLDPNNKCIALTDNLDPDSQLFSNLIACDYFSGLMFNDKLSKLSAKKAFSFLHLNT